MFSISIYFNLHTECDFYYDVRIVLPIQHHDIVVDLHPHCLCLIIMEWIWKLKKINLSSFFPIEPWKQQIFPKHRNTSDIVRTDKLIHLYLLFVSPIHEISFVKIQSFYSVIPFTKDRSSTQSTGNNLKTTVTKLFSSNPAIDQTISENLRIKLGPPSQLSSQITV